MNLGDSVTNIATDSSWICESDLGITETQCFSQVTEAEYDRFWLSAALWKEESKISAPQAFACLTLSVTLELLSLPNIVSGVGLERRGVKFGFSER